VIEDYWGPRRHCREIVIHRTARAKQRSGRRWVHPDLVMECHPGRKSHPDVAKLIHTFEVEAAGGHRLGVSGSRPGPWSGLLLGAVPARRRPREQRSDWDRILWAAGLGVGLVGFSKSSSVWDVECEAKRRKHTKAERQGFLETVLAPRLERWLGLITPAPGLAPRPTCPAGELDTGWSGDTGLWPHLRFGRRSRRVYLPGEGPPCSAWCERQ
jgi:hypothetical protein